MPEGNKVKRITEEEVVVREYTEERIDEAIINLTKQIDELIEEREIWLKRKKKVEAVKDEDI
jgi:hypothetical protein